MENHRLIDIKWSANLAYAVGLIASDGNLSKDGRHIIMTSKDMEIILNFQKCLDLKNKIGRKSRGTYPFKKYFYLQFSNKNFYNFLLDIGLTPAKSKTIGDLKIPNPYFPDFLRGMLDGDGNINIFKHPESKHPQLRVRFFSASPNFIEWLKASIRRYLEIEGFQRYNYGAIDLAYAKASSIKLLNFIYYNNFKYCLTRKYIKAKPFLI